MGKALGPLRFAALGLLLGGLVLTVWAFYIEPNRLSINEVTVPLPDWPQDFDRLKVAVLSDLHVGAPYVKVDTLKRIVLTVNRSKPDLVVILGDFVIQGVLGGRFIEPELIAPELKGLQSRFGTFAVLGNHDWWYDGPRVMRALKGAGIFVLENEATQIQQGDHLLWLAGLADPLTRQPDIQGTFQRIPKGEPVLVLVHNPDIFPEIPSTAALTLAGHTHGGQVHLPFLGRLIVPSKFGSRYAIGHIQEGSRHLFVTPGVGTSIIPVRFRVPPEISILTITTMPEPAPTDQDR